MTLNDLDVRMAELLGWTRKGDHLWEAGPNDLRYSGPAENKPKTPHKTWHPSVNLNDAMEVWVHLRDRVNANRGENGRLYVAMEDNDVCGFEVGLRYLDRHNVVRWHDGPFSGETSPLAICRAAGELLKPAEPESKVLTGNVTSEEGTGNPQ